MNYATIDYHLKISGINIPDTYNHTTDSGEEIEINDFKSQVLKEIKNKGKGTLLSLEVGKEFCINCKYNGDIHKINYKLE